MEDLTWLLSGDRPPDPVDTWYTRCPDCGLVGVPSAALHHSRPGSDEPDLSRPAEITCGICGCVHVITDADLLVTDATHTCRHCRHVTAVPASAGKVVCARCGLHAPGPAARVDQRTADQVRVATDLHYLEMKSALDRAKRKTGWI